MMLNFTEFSMRPHSKSIQDLFVDNADNSYKAFYIGDNKYMFHIRELLFDYNIIAIDNGINITEAIEHVLEIKPFSPSVIIISYPAKDITKLLNVLGKKASFANVPVLLMTEGRLHLSPELIRGFDDIISLNISRTDLVRKILFLNKFKTLKTALEARGDSFKLSAPDTISPERKVLLSIDNVFKRLLDILIATTALLILSPLMLLIALIIKLESKGPVLYSSNRAGTGYRIFKFYKFRTMIADADKKLNQLSHLNQYDVTGQKGPVFFKVSNDPRITPWGRFLRNTSFDELPQLFNVLKGDMSLVGNRPLPLYEARTLTTDQFAERFLAPAGITGLWQIRKRGQKDMSTEERIRLDIDYAQKSSFIYDMWIMVKTPSAIFQKDNV